MRTFLKLAWLAVALVVSACDAGEQTALTIDGIEIQAATSRLSVGDTARIAARAVAGGVEVPVGGISWTSADTAVVRVAGSGASARVEARRAGSAVVTANVAGKTAAVLIEVANAVPQIEALSPANVQVGAAAVEVEVRGSRFARDARVRWNEREITPTWVSAQLLRVQLNAELLAAEATVQLTVVNGTPGGGISASIPFVVTAAPVAYVQLDRTSHTMQVGDTVRLRAITRDASGRELADRVVTWQSSVPGVADISASGLTTARTAGSAVVTAQSEGRQAMLLLEVTQRTNAVPHITSLAPDSAPAGSDFVITIRGRGFRAGVSHAFWNTTSVPAEVVSDSVMHVTLWEDLRRLSTTGAVRVMNAAPGGGWSNSVTFRITPVVRTISLSPYSAFMWPGETLRFRATAFDERGQAMPDRTFTWETQYSAIATVDANGDVRAHAEGTTLVRATVDGRSATAHVTVLRTAQQHLLVEAQTGTGPELWIVDVAAPANRVRLMPGRYARDAAVAPDGARIAFVGRDANGNEDIYVAARDGSNVRRLTTHAALDDQPQWSPDGNSIVFRSRRFMHDEGFGGVSGIWLMNADGSGQHNIEVSGFLMPHAEDPTFSHDGRRIYAAVGDLNFWPLHTRIMAYDIATAQWTHVTDGSAGSDDDVTAAPDGRTLIVRRRTGDTSVLQRIDPTGQMYYMLDILPGRVPAYSANGTLVAYEADDDSGRSSVFVAQSSLGQGRLIVVNGKNPVWIDR